MIASMKQLLGRSDELRLDGVFVGVGESVSILYRFMIVLDRCVLRIVSEM